MFIITVLSLGWASWSRYDCHAWRKQYDEIHRLYLLEKKTRFRIEKKLEQQPGHKE